MLLGSAIGAAALELGMSTGAEIHVLTNGGTVFGGLHRNNYGLFFQKIKKNQSFTTRIL